LSGGTPISLGRRLEEVNGIGPSFDHLRIGLALSILFWHSFGICYGQDYARTLPAFPVPPLLGALLPMFFALSGFLVIGSAIRTASLRTFVTFRLLRIVPALFTEIVISALVLGPLLTAYPLRAYFGDPRFIEYFGSLIGRVRFVLPGLFLDNPAPEYVNLALWTVGPEILCYVFLSALMVTGAYRRPRTMMIVTLGYAAICMMADIWFPPARIIEVLPTKMLILAFLAGNLLFLYRDRIAFSRPLAALAFAGAIGLVLLMRQQQQELYGYPAVPLFTYVTAVIGLSRLPPMPFFHRGDYSYGIYIYGFPIQQAIAHFLPHHRIWWINFAIALPIVLLFAVASWHLIEKPCLGLRKTILGRQGKTALPQAHAGRRHALIFAALCAYGLFVTDAAGVLPIRPLAKAVLGPMGLYTRPAGPDHPGVSL
jgi:peptidoglycan/LPS O-acetylase OafA/YrhL